MEGGRERTLRREWVWTQGAMVAFYGRYGEIAKRCRGTINSEKVMLRSKREADFQNFDASILYDCMKF